MSWPRDTGGGGGGDVTKAELAASGGAGLIGNGASTVAADITAINAAATTLAGRVTVNEGAITTLDQRMDDVDDDITAINAAATDLADRVTVNEGAIAGKVDTSTLSYAPAANKAPLGDAGGFINNAWLSQTQGIIVGGARLIKISVSDTEEVLEVGSLVAAPGVHRTAIKMGYPTAGYGTRIVSGGDNGVSYAEYLAFERGTGPGAYAESGRWSLGGNLLIGTTVDNGVDKLQVAGSTTVSGILSAAQMYSLILKINSSDLSLLRNNINRESSAAMGAEILYVARDTQAAPCLAVLASDGQGGWSAATSVLYVGKNSTSLRSLSAAGTINASGADYAEYISKTPASGTIAPGQIVGIDGAGCITDKWGDAITFMVKSTKPSIVGGDNWAQHLGQRPTEPVRESGDTDGEWFGKQAQYEEAASAFDVALEVARKTVDRIAFAGQVPVNVTGATPGQYIVPVQDGEGVKGVAIDAPDMTLQQYMLTVGKVIAVEPDGRARIIVKPV